MDDDNIFDNDDALDYIIYEELAEEEKNKKSNGCLSIIVLLIAPGCTFVYWLKNYIIH